MARTATCKIGPFQCYKNLNAISVSRCVYLFEKTGIPVLPVHLLKAKILASKCQMQFSFEYVNMINKTSKLNHQTHSEANGKHVGHFEKRKISKYFLASLQSVMLSSPLSLNEIQPNLVCE